jgi:hypothetical protein
VIIQLYHTAQPNDSRGIFRTDTSGAKRRQGST